MVGDCQVLTSGGIGIGDGLGAGVRLGPTVRVGVGAGVRTTVGDAASLVVLTEADGTPAKSDLLEHPAMTTTKVMANATAPGDRRFGFTMRHPRRR